MAYSCIKFAVDWRDKGVVTPVRHQEIDGPCWAFAACSAIESIHAIKKGELVVCSPQQLVDCVYPKRRIRMGGFEDDAFEWVIENGGICEDKYYPYIARKQKYKAPKGGKMIAIDGYKYVPPYKENLLRAVAKQPICASIAASYEFTRYEGGIFADEYYWHPSQLNHMVLIVGYGSQDGEDYWIIKNSSGTNWGCNGYMYLRRNSRLPYGECAIQWAASYPIIDH